MTDIRTVTYPASMVGRVADVLQEANWSMDRDDAEALALDVVIDVVNAVDDLRAQEKAA